MYTTCRTGVNTTMAKSSRWWTGLVLFLALLLAERSSGVVTTCPASCRCDAESISCTASNLAALPAEFPNNVTVTQLVVHRTQIKFLDNTSFANLRGLRLIDFSNNVLQGLADRTFEGLDKLERLTLRRNYIRELTNETFVGLGNLTFLDLSYNDLVSLPDFPFLPLSSLESLDLARNQIEELTADSLSGLGGLKSLNLARNKLLYLEPTYFQPLSSVEKLILEDSQVRLIPAHAFKSLGALKILSLNGNKLTNFDASAFRNMSDPASKEVPLEELSLKGTQIVQLPVLTFRTLTNLRSLDISNTSITTVGESSFSMMGELRNLTIDSCPALRNISNGAFRGLYKLEKLVITNNPLLRELGWAVFSNLSSLSFLSLQNNQMSTFRESMADWTNIDHVDLRLNPIRCDCHSRWMLSLLVEPTNVTVHLPTSSSDGDSSGNTGGDGGDDHSSQPQAIKYQLSTTTTITTSSLTRQINCSTPPQLHGTPLHSLSPEEFVCPMAPDLQSQKHGNDKRFKVGIIAASITCFFLAAFALFVKFRSRICSACRGQYRYKAYHGGSNGINGNLPKEDAIEMEDTQFEELESDSSEAKMRV